MQAAAQETWFCISKNESWIWKCCRTSGKKIWCSSKKTENARPSYLPTAPAAPKTVEHKPSADFAPSDTSGLQVGQKVEHQKFGFGTVSKMEGSAHNPIATVNFDMNGEKKIMLNYAKLRILE
jgi:DNA helicase-2/ATP-dependent DNA helicase PcrA